MESNNEHLLYKHQVKIHPM